MGAYIAMSSPIAFQWSGEAMEPVPRFRKECDGEFVIGEVYTLVTQESRSSNSHRHYFASINSAWLNLPEDIGLQFATSEHLRKYALIKGGFYDSQSIVCASKAEAVKVASFVRPCDEFSVVTVSEATVTRYTAQSQSMKAMGKEKFQKSKDAVLEIIAAIVGVTVKELAEP